MFRPAVPHRSRILIGQELFWPCRPVVVGATNGAGAQELWRELQAENVAAVAACYPSAEALRPARRGRRGRATGCTRRCAAEDCRSRAEPDATLVVRWSAFLEVHGDEYGFDESIGPTVDLAVTFQTHGYHERLTFSTTEESGMGDSWGKLAVPYLLPRYVFPLMEHAGWTDLRVHDPRTR